MEERRRLRKYKRSNNKVWEKTECRSKIIRKVGYDREKKETLREKSY